jgi:hypothetical protein
MAKNKNNNQNKGGRPPKITDEVLGKLEQAFSIGCTDQEACSFADINPSTLYAYQKKKPKFIGEKRV